MTFVKPTQVNIHVTLQVASAQKKRKYITESQRLEEKERALYEGGSVSSNELMFLY